MHELGEEPPNCPNEVGGKYYRYATNTPNWDFDNLISGDEES